MKIFIKILVGVLLISVAIGVIKIAFFPAHVFNKSVDTAYQITDKTLDAENVLQNYEWFKQQYEDYNAIQKKIINAQLAVNDFEKNAGSRDKWTFEDKTEDARLQTIVTGLKQQEEDIIAEYNAKSKMQNRALFKTRDLPYQLESIN